MSKPKPPRILKTQVRLVLTNELDNMTRKAAAKAGLSQSAFLGLAVRYGFPAARAAALAETKEAA